MKRAWGTHRSRLIAGAAAAALAVSTYAALRTESQQNPTTLEDFFIAGTQPDMLVDDLFDSVEGGCAICHGVVSVGEIEVYWNWQSSMMGQAARDPLFYACLAIANQDVPESGDLCIRCHTPMAWLEGRSTPTDGSALMTTDRDGVNCHVCHRMVDPVFQPGVSPPVDEAILAMIDPLPTRPGNGNFIVDPFDRRRGPFDFVPPQLPPPHPVETPFLYSPFHRTGAMCGTCHDVSNPVLERQPDGSYAPGTPDMAHATGDSYDMFPIERTYSEWLNSDYPNGVDAGGRFGGDIFDGVVSTCQDCHMPKREGQGCIYLDDYPVRPDIPKHDFAGGNSWIRDTIADLWPNDVIPDDPTFRQRLAEGQEQSIDMLQRAATLEVSQEGAVLMVRVINETGHKLPTGYPEGRRMWLNVQFYDAGSQMLGERGDYNLLSAELQEHNTKVYEIELGLDETMAALTGLPLGPSFHFVLNNKVFKDNRIPPRGFTNAAYADFGGRPVGAAYAEGQYWDDTAFAMPPGATRATVGLRYQTSSKEYIEFLRDENHTNSWGDLVHDQWAAKGKSEPVRMASVSIDLAPFWIADADDDGDCDLSDFAAFQACYTGANAEAVDAGCELFDFHGDHDVDLADFAILQRAFTGE